MRLLGWFNHWNTKTATELEGDELPNRRQLEKDIADRFDPRLARGETVVVVILKVNHFKMPSFQGKAAANSARQSLLQRGQAADSPATVVSSALIAEIPI